MIAENVKIVKKAEKSTWYGFKIEGNDNWFTVEGVEPIKEFQAIKEGDVVTITYTKKGIKQNVEKIVLSSAPVNTDAIAKKEEIVKASPELIKASEAPKPVEKPQSTWTGKSTYGSPEDTAGKEVGCAAGVAATIVAAMIDKTTPIETVLQTYRKIANDVLEHIRASK